VPVVGTAGHVDHGKSTLIHALTGRDPDRWAAEKERGLTIDLGFAWTVLPDDTEVSFVDVPGHQRFIKNMLSGIEAIDVALFVVAADEGWMPQSEEHLAVLDLLGVHHGIVALTKIDRVDEDLVAIATIEIEEHLAGTSLEGAHVVPVSAPTGVGINELRSALVDQVSIAVASFRDRGRPRMWIDRSFTIAGSGTVVTGTLLDGPLSVGDRVMIWPDRRSARIRSLQTHERAHDQVSPHSRVAANLTGLDRRDITRGAMMGSPDAWAASARFLASVRLARYVDQPITSKGAFHLHLGSGTWPVRVRPLDGSGIDAEGFALLTTGTALPVMVGDPFILREVGRRQVVAGGRVLDPDPQLTGDDMVASASLLAGVLDTSPDEQAETLLQVRGSDAIEHLAQHSGGGEVTALTVAGIALSDETTSRLADRAALYVQRFHESNPLRPGVPKADLAGRLGVSTAILDALVSRSETLQDVGPFVAATGFAVELGADATASLGELVSMLKAGGLLVPKVGELAIDRETLHALVRRGDLVQVSDDLVYLPDQIEEIKAGLSALPNPFTVAEFRDRFQISRKYAVPLLEWLDSSSITRRNGDQRSY
jgi:selenocysteine-specific elongation factor